MDTYAPGSSDGNSQGNPDASAVFADTLIRNLRNLTLDNIRPSSPPLDYAPPQQQYQDWKNEASSYGAVRKRRGVRTLLSVQRSLKERMLRLKKQYMRQLCLPEARMRAFQCTCDYCRSHRQTPEKPKPSVETNNDMESN